MKCSDDAPITADIEVYLCRPRLPANWRISIFRDSYPGGKSKDAGKSKDGRYTPS